MKRDHSLDVLRIIACVMVVGIHIAMEGWYSISPRTYTWGVLNFYDTLFRPAVPLFFMISGALFLRMEHIDRKKLWLKNMLRLGIIYLLWAFFYAVMNDGMRKTLADPAQILSTVFGPNPQYHLWYLRSLMAVYAIAPLLWVMVRGMDEKLTRYFLLLFGVFGLLRSTLFELPFLPVWLHDQINLFSEMELVRYSAYFMLGYIFTDERREQRFSMKTLVPVYLITLIAAAGLNHWIAAADDWPTQALYGNFSLPVAIETVCIFLMVRKAFPGWELSARGAAWLRRISASTLFVYLVHPFVIQRLHIYFGLNTTDHNVLFSVPMMILLVFVISSGCGMILERIPVLRKVL